MTPEQYIKLKALSTKVAEVVLFDADPANWIGNGVAPKDLTKEQRGDAYWCRKLAVSSLSVFGRLINISDTIQDHSSRGNGAAEVEPEDDTLDAEIDAAEKAASKLMDKLTQRTNKAKFDKHVHGKT